MTTFKKIGEFKNIITLFAVILTATSLFGLVIPTIYSFEESAVETKESNSFQSSHPLVGSSDNVEQCTANGLDLHEIYLCGVNDERLLVTNIPNTTQVTWSILDQGSCSAATPSCPNTDPGCIWNTLSTDTQFNVIDAGEYRIFVRYTDGTQEPFYFNVYSNGLNPNALVQNIDCGSPGSITITNVPDGYEYSITSGASWQDSNTFSINSVSNYDVQIRKKNDAGGCILTMDDIAVGNNSIDATASVNQITCNATSGSITVDIANPSTSYIFKLTQGGNLLESSGPIPNGTYTFTNLNVGNYDVEVTLASISNCSWNGDFDIDPFTIVAPDAVATKNIDCTDGVITVTKTGGSAPFEYSLDNGVSFIAFTAGNQTTMPIATAGSYTVKVKDANDCISDSNTVTVNTETEISSNVVQKDVSCSGVDDGSITINVTNTEGYSVTYSIDGINFQTSKVFSNLAAGNYDVVIRKQKAGGVCDLTPTTTTVGTSPSFTATASIIQQINCTTGSATIRAVADSGAVAPIEYSLDGATFQTSTDFTGLGAGDYTITVKDANQCTTTVDQAVTSSSDLSDLTFLTSNIDCSTGATNLQITVQGGQSPFSYRMTAPTVIDNGPSDSFSALTPNTYTFEVTADNGCIITRNFTVSQPIHFSANASVKTNVSCATTGASDGSIEVTIENFDTSFNVIIEDGTGADTGLGVSNATVSPVSVTGLTTDTYTIRISDTSGPCEQVETLTVSEPTTPLSLDSFAVTNMNCGSPGSITIEASGGWGNYSYQISQPDATITPSQNNKNITGLTQAGTHTIILKDINGCTLDTVTFDLIDQGGPSAAVDTSVGSPTNYCYSTANQGVLKIDVSGGEAPYFYTINNGTPIAVPVGDSFTLNNLTPLDYIIKIIGNNGCETIVADTKIAGQLFALAEITKPYGCGTTPDAIINVTPEEGYPPYTYTVNGGTAPVTMPFMASAEGSYVFTVTDSKDCTITTEPVEVTAAPALGFNHNITDTACGKAGTGSIQLMGTGGTPPYQYAFSNTPFSGTNPALYETKAVYNNLDATTYFFAIRDDLGCVIENEQAIIGAEMAITAEIEKTDITCDATNGGNVWGNIKVSNILNSTGPVNISLVRVQDPVKYAAGDETRTWAYRNYQNIDLATNSNYLNAFQPSNYGTTTGFDIRMYWAFDFVVRVEDERGCFWESSIYNIASPPLPSIINSDPIDQTCANGATYDFSINDIDSDSDGTPDLVGPFDVRLYPYRLIDNDGDGEEDDVTSGWRPFNDASNPAWDGIAGTAGNPNERDYRFTNSALYGKLLFGVAYSVAIRDNNTGCVRWRALRPVVQPPTGFITVDATPQSESCLGSQNGEVEITISNSSPGPLDIKVYSANRPQNSGFYYSPTAPLTSTGAPVTFTVPNMRVSWYVVEVEDSSGCQAGERFLIYRPKTKLNLKQGQIVQPTCHEGGQVAVTATGGWDNERYFNIRNKLRQTWHPYDYALVLNSQTPTDADFGPDNFWTNVVPTAYDGINNVYRAYVRDGSDCIEPIPNPITFTQDAIPVVGSVAVSNRCSSPNEIYDISVTMADLGTNPNGGTPDYIWNGVVTSSSTKQLGPGTHTLQVRDENGCSAVESIFIYPQMVSNANITQVEQCNPPNSGQVTIDVYGGSTDYTFTRLDNSETNTTGIFTELTHSTTYTFEVTDNQSGCPTQTVNATLDAPIPPDFQLVTPVQHISCFGANDGKIVVEQNPTAANLDIAYTYNIDAGPYQTSNLFENLTPGAHTITVRSAKNCIQTLGPIIINEPSEFILTASETSTFSCTADNKMGMATIEASVGGSGTAPYQYSFNNGSFGSTDSYQLPYSSADQTVTIDVIDANGCTDQSTITILAVTKLTATHNVVTSMDCATDGEYEIVIPATITNFSIVELPSASPVVTITGTTILITRSNPGNYSFLITDNDSGCTDIVVIEIPAFDTLEMLAAHDQDVTCYNGNDGSLTFTATGYSGPFEYTVFDSTDAIVPGKSNLSENTASGAIIVNDLAAGIYYVDIRATNTPGCKEISNYVTIQSPAVALDFQWEITNELTCNPGSDAQITVSPEGGWGTYSIELVNDASGATMPATATAYNIFDNLEAGDYTLTVIDVQGCPIVKTLNIPQIGFIQLDLAGPSVTQPSCTGFSNGSITVSATQTNPSGTFQYILTNEITGVSRLPQTNPDFNDLAQGDYTVTVIDGYGCDVSTNVIEIRDPSSITTDAAITLEPTCPSNNIGEVTVTGSGGSGSYNFRILAPSNGENPLTTTSPETQWTTTASTTHPYSNLAAGTYEFESRDAIFLCPSPITVIRTINVVEPLEISVDETNTILNCNGDSDAILVALAEKGLGGYEYQLEDDSSTILRARQPSETFDMLGAGSYRIRAFSGADCEILSELIVIVPPALLDPILGPVQDVQCFGNNDGNFEIIINSGEAPFKYILSSEPSKAVDSALFEGLPPGTYAVTVQDVNGCEEIVTDITIGGPTAALEATVVNPVNEVCAADDDGSFDVHLSGGTAPYYYSVGDPNGTYNAISGSTHPFTNLDAGFYEIYVRDENGCQASPILQEIRIGSDLRAEANIAEACMNGNPFYSVTISLLNDEQDTEPLMYSLDGNPSQLGATFSDISSGSHAVQIDDSATGCTETITFEVIAQEQLTLALGQGEINQIVVEASGGDRNYTYYFEGVPQATGNYYITRDGTYTVRVVDGKGCEAALQITMEFIDIVIPNFFSPNGDGIRDVWRIANNEAFPNMFVHIYDRYGRTIKEFIGSGEWDGSYNNEVLPAGDYWYIIKLNGVKDEREFVGHFSVYR